MARQISDPYRPLQRRFWMVERIGWAVLTLVIVWAVAGGAGGGLLSQARLQKDGVELVYDRFARKGARLPIELRWPALPGRELSLSFDAGFVDRLGIDFARHGLQPARSGNTVTIDLGAAADSGGLRLNAHPVESGSSASLVGINGQPLGRISIFVFP
ncbi:MAG: hypothetical protein AB7R90_14130 [Reyranellaceae bacterium]